MNYRFLKFAGLGILAFTLTGCPKRAVIKPEESKPEETKAMPPTEEPNLRVGPEYKEIPELQAIYFDLDQSTLRSDARDVLQKNYDVLKGHADWEALVEGHCDERGTTEYNLGLGQKRAASVRQYYMSLGLSGKRVATISYGKENPACSEHNEDCWSKNRRGVTKVRSVQTKQEGSTTSSPSTSSEPMVK
jgi:peptidoglycan-associated lipoprotein